jgi:hypothetical protein
MNLEKLVRKGLKKAIKHEAKKLTKEMRNKRPIVCGDIPYTGEPYAAYVEYGKVQP